MKRIYCEHYHNPPHSFGDCTRACVASLAEDENVPHTFDTRSPENSWAAMRKYLHSKGKFLVLWDVESTTALVYNNPDIHVMILGATESGVDHAMIYRNGKPIHNPSKNKEDVIVKPHSCGNYIIGVVGNLI